MIYRIKSFDNNRKLFAANCATQRDCLIRAVSRKMDLSRAELSGWDLSGISLPSANLSGARFRHARFLNADLSGANLSGCDFQSASLCVAALPGTNLQRANLCGSNLFDADLSRANLSHANLSVSALAYANLNGANLLNTKLDRTNLTGVHLSEAIINWESHEMVAEILRREAKEDLERLKVAGLILLQKDWCWSRFIQLGGTDPIVDWALDALAPYVQPGDYAPAVLTKRKARQEQR